MPRRPHKKSRRGCITCKKRHIKCDERHPNCVQCETAELECVYPASPLAGISPSDMTATLAPPLLNPSPRSPHTVDGNSDESPISWSSTTNPAALNLMHLELLHQFLTETYSTFNDIADEQRVWQTVVIKLALRYPFVFCEILAISALHIAHLHPSKASRYQNAATELQSQALASFTASGTEITKENCGAYFLFSTLLAIHVFADPTLSTGLGHAEYLDHFLGCFSLMRGIRAMGIEQWWPSLHTGELKDLFNIPQPEAPYNDIPEQCKKLSELTVAGEISPKSVDVYAVAIERLQWLFALSEVPAKRYKTPRYLFAWPVQLSQEFNEFLKMRRPEALIVLAYYAVILVYYREAWCVGDSGVALIKSINAHVGSGWNQWMAWPNVVAAGGGFLPNVGITSPQ